MNIKKRNVNSVTPIVAQSSSSKKKKSKKPKSYIRHHYKVLKSQYKLLSNMLRWAKEDSYKFVAHILSCQLYRYKEDNEGYVPIPYEVRKRFCKEAEIEELVKDGFIERLIINEDKEHYYSIEYGICTSYRVVESIVEDFIRLEDISAVEYINAAKVNLFDGKRCRAINKSTLTDHTNNSYPKLIVEAIKCIEQCTFELAPVEEHIRKLKTEMLGAEFIYGKDSSEYKKARGRYLNDNACLKNALNQNAIEVLPGFYSYTPNYSVGDTGRIHTFMQNASREMKDAAFSNVNNLKNYDLRSSQAIGLIQQFEIAGLDTTWLENYKNDKQAKYNYAAQIGISVDTWKKCLCALLMGGYLPKKLSENSNAKITEYLIEEAEGDFIKASEYQYKLTQVVTPLMTEIAKWHEWLLSTYVKKIGNYAAGKLYMTNPTGKSICIDDLPKGKDIWQRKAKVAAFVLQGQEAAFIHHLTILSLQYDYKVIQNEHDGVVSIGAIPDEAVKQASSFAGMEYAKLEEKPFN